MADAPQVAYFAGHFKDDATPQLHMRGVELLSSFWTPLSISSSCRRITSRSSCERLPSCREIYWLVTFRSPEKRRLG